MMDDSKLQSEDESIPFPGISADRADVFLRKLDVRLLCTLRTVDWNLVHNLSLNDAIVNFDDAGVNCFDCIA